jgi:hypothetical protein
MTSGFDRRASLSLVNKIPPTSLQICKVGRIWKVKWVDSHHSPSANNLVDILSAFPPRIPAFPHSPQFFVLLRIDSNVFLLLH